MVRKLWLGGVLIVLCGAAALGCNRNAVQQKPPPDPLLISTPGGVSVKVSNKSVAVKVQPDPADARSQAYPQPPSPPDNPTVTPASRLVPLPSYKE
jgi:hypothetical protein